MPLVLSHLIDEGLLKQNRSVLGTVVVPVRLQVWYSIGSPPTWLANCSVLLVERLSLSLLAAKGTVVNISSQIGSLAIAQKMSGDVSYAASKAALNMVAAKQAQAFSGRGVSVITMHPA